MGKIIGALAVIGLLVGWYFLWGIEFCKVFWMGLYPILPPVIAAIIVVAGVITATVFRGWFGWVVAVMGTAAFIWFCVVLPYDTGHNYVESVQVTDDSPDTYAERAPYEVALADAKANLQESIGELQGTKSLAADGENGNWNSLVASREWQSGYESVQVLDIPLFGTIKSTDVSFCDFNPDHQLRFGGALPHNNLGRAIIQALPLSVTYDEGDAYAYCDDSGVPMIVAPLKDLTGFWGATWVAYGVAVYNGETGELRILTDSDDIAKIPGPVYPLSLARDTLNAYQAGGDFWSWAQNRFGFERASDNGEISLRIEDTEDVAYVSALTPRGDSLSVVGLATVENRTFTSGERNPVIIHTYSGGDVRMSNDTVEQNILSDYSYMPDWASGMRIFEIVPAGKDSWVASIGQAKSIVYRAYITPEGDAVLFDKNGNEVARVTSTTPDGTVTVPIDSELDELTIQELRELIDSALDELESRTAAE